AIALYVIWILAVNGAIDPTALAGQTGTALDPLASVAGPSVRVFGVIFVVVAMGVAVTHKAEVLGRSVRGWFPRQSRTIALLQRGQGRLVFAPRGSIAGEDGRLVLTYVGLAGGRPRFRLQARIAGQSWR